MLDIFYIHKGVLKKAGHEELPKIKNLPLWIDATGLKAEEEILLQEVFNLHPLTIEDMKGQITRVKVEDFKKYIFCIFYGIEKNEKLRMVELDFVIGKNFIITSHTDKRNAFEQIKQTDDKIRRLLEKGSVFLFHKLLDLEIDNYFPILEHIEDSIEKIDEDVTDKRSHDLLDRILEVRKHIIMIKRYATPQREKLKKLLQLNHKLIDKKAYPYFRDLQDNAIKISESIENYNEAVSHTFSIYMSAVSKSMNEVMKVLSVIATIALPLTVISSIYGTNFLKLPGAGHEYGFWIMIAGMVAVVAIMMYAFRRRGWF